MINQNQVKFFSGVIQPRLGWNVVSPNDIIVEGIENENPSDFDQLSNIIPYCIDFHRKSLIGIRDIDPLVAAKATFHYIYLREHAKKFIEITKYSKFYYDFKTPIASTLLFSPGRCGSTLLSKIISSIGIASISEPDFHSQAAIYLSKCKDPSEFKEILSLLHLANNYLIAPFANVGHKNILIKMRSHVNLLPEAIVASLIPRPRTIFLNRQFETWCASRMRAFSNTLDDNLAIYIRSQQCLTKLQKFTNCLVVNYEDLQSRPSSVIEKLAIFFDLKIDTNAVNSVLEEDSQSETALSRSRIKDRLSQQELFAISAIWSKYKNKLST